MKQNLFIALVAILFGCAACNQNTPEVEAITLDKVAIQLTIGQSDTIVATTTPADAVVAWSSSNPTVAVVVNGVVTGVGNGTAVVVATAGNQLASCVVTVGAGSNNPTESGINFMQYLEGSEYYIFLLDEKAMSRIKGTVHKFHGFGATVG